MNRSLIVAMDRQGVIGHEGGLPWRQRADLQRFKRLTMGHAIIMGRKTYDSIQRLLPGRKTVIVTRQADWKLPGATVVHSLHEAWTAVDEDPQPFVVGGAEIYAAALPAIETLYLTRIEAEVPGDTSFPAWDPDGWELVEAESHPEDEANQFAMRFEVWRRRTSGA